MPNSDLHLNPCTSRKGEHRSICHCTHSAISPDNSPVAVPKNLCRGCVLTSVVQLETKGSCTYSSKERKGTLICKLNPVKTRIESTNCKTCQFRSGDTNLPRVGTKLKQLLSRLGFKTTNTCNCSDIAYKMDRLGLEWCRENEDLLVRKIEAEAGKRKLPTGPATRFTILRLLRFVFRRCN